MQEQVQGQGQIGRRLGATVLVFSFGLLFYELCLTRVLSVLFYYHTAFLAISLAMLGLGAGGVWVYLFAPRFEKGVAPWMLAIATLIVLQTLLFSWIRFDVSLLERFWTSIVLPIFLLVALSCWLPFLAGGVVFAYWFRRYQASASTLYAWDLVGAALGALLLVPLMGWLGGMAALLWCAAICALAAWGGAREEGRDSLARVSLVGAVALLLLTGIQVQWDVFTIQVDRERTAATSPVLYKKWNAFSRVVVLPQQGWMRGLSPPRKAYWRDKMPQQLEALIDINAFAPIVKFDGDKKKVRYLKELVSNVGHHLLPPGREVMILGPGGGKDILGALLFAPKRVVGIELNPILVHDVVRQKFRTFAGDLYRHPKVKVHVGEGRAVLTRLKARFDLLIANSVVTWAAHSSGAMNLAEHSLYTVESCGLYLDRLKPGGILSVSLWDLTKHGLPIRWIATCAQAAKQRGIKALDQHIAVIGNPWSKKVWFSTVLLSRTPWSSQQKKTLVQISQRFGFDLLYMPGGLKNAANFTRYFRSPSTFVKNFSLDLRPAIDDRPFFLYTVRWQDALRFWQRNIWEEDAAFINLLLSFVLVSVLLVLLIGVPLVWKRVKLGESAGLSNVELMYFLCIGLGFMLVEVPLIQRLTLYLGHPTYALTVVLAGLLLSCGLGSAWSDRWPQTQVRTRWRFGLLALVVMLWLLQLVFAFLLPATKTWTTWLQISLVLLVLAPLGAIMGVALPLGMRHLREDAQLAIPWAWGINGASSVVASIAALWIAAEFGFRFVFWLASGFYLVACLCVFLWPSAIMLEGKSDQR